ncbi:L-threonylcarbamoyladenylate synthase [Vagococcus salmoninarum]|uniref:L-threonylcarbamoyladenylate synthase n=1 Tax=Vagococcus salmoninarum TaxID=2739 RepID=UPI003F9A4ED4
METKIFKQANIEAAANCLKAGEVVAFPTETVYGLGADATNALAIAKVYQAKGRPSDNPLIVHITDKSQLSDYVTSWSEKAEKLMTAFWPGPLTLIFNIKKGSLPNNATGGLGTVGFRVPNNQLALDLIAKAGVPLVGPSANTSGRPSPTTAAHVFHDLAGKIAGILDDGPTEVGLESTVLDLTSEIPVILRPGLITQEQLMAVVGDVKLDQHLVDENEAPKAPGMKYQHYAPVTKVMMIDCHQPKWGAALKWANEEGLQVGLLANQQLINQYQGEFKVAYPLSQDNNVLVASKNLFSGLRELDELDPQLDLILAETYPDQGEGRAYMNRLKKAANQEYFN